MCQLPQVCSYFLVNGESASDLPPNWPMLCRQSHSKQKSALKEAWKSWAALKLRRKC